MDAAVIALTALAAILGGVTGAALCWLFLNHHVEALHAYVHASQLDRSPQRLATVDARRAAWRAAVRRWVRLHLPHRRAAA